MRRRPQASRQRFVRLHHRIQRLYRGFLRKITLWSERTWSGTGKACRTSSGSTSMDHSATSPFTTSVRATSANIPSCRTILADSTNGRAYATVLRPPVAVSRLSVTLCIVAKRCVQEQKLLLKAYSYMRNRLVPKWMSLIVLLRSYQGHVNHCVTFAIEYLGNR